MVKINKIIIILMLVILVLPVNAEKDRFLGYGSQNDRITLLQTCDNCTYVNLTRVKLPNLTFIDFNLPMTKSGGDYNISFANTSAVGEYSYTTCGDNNGVFACQNVNFIINYGGHDLPISQSILYSLFFVFAVVLFFTSLIIGINLPTGHILDESGNIITRNKKYAKVVFLFSSYLIFIWIIFLAYGISLNFLFLQGISTFFYIFYRILLISMLLIAPLGLWIVVSWFFDDKRMKKAFERGLSLEDVEFGR